MNIGIIICILAIFTIVVISEYNKEQPIPNPTPVVTQNNALQIDKEIDEEIDKEINYKMVDIDVLNNGAIINYDMNKIYNPLIEPTRRPQRYSIPTPELKNIIDLPTRGYPDNYSLIGICETQKTRQ